MDLQATITLDNSAMLAGLSRMQAALQQSVAGLQQMASMLPTAATGSAAVGAASAANATRLGSETSARRANAAAMGEEISISAARVQAYMREAAAAKAAQAALFGGLQPTTRVYPTGVYPSAVGGAAAAGAATAGGAMVGGRGRHMIGRGLMTAGMFASVAMGGEDTFGGQAASVAGMAAMGAQIGGSVGPWGAAIGAVVGGVKQITTLWSGFSKKAIADAQEIAKALSAIQLSHSERMLQYDEIGKSTKVGSELQNEKDSQRRFSGRRYWGVSSGADAQDMASSEDEAKSKNNALADTQHALKELDAAKRKTQNDLANVDAKWQEKLSPEAIAKRKQFSGLDIIGGIPAVAADYYGTKKNIEKDQTNYAKERSVPVAQLAALELERKTLAERLSVLTKEKSAAYNIRDRMALEKSDAVEKRSKDKEKESLRQGVIGDAIQRINSVNSAALNDGHISALQKLGIGGAGGFTGGNEFTVIASNGTTTNRLLTQISDALTRRNNAELSGVFQ